MLSMKEMNIGCIRSMNDVVCLFIRVTGYSFCMIKPGVLLGVLHGFMRRMGYLILHTACCFRMEAGKLPGKGLVTYIAGVCEGCENVCWFKLFHYLCVPKRKFF
jgi:hypothetical protein